jgi:aminoglycoside 6'-N-acetyltransferase I
MAEAFVIQTATADHLDDWAKLRFALWDWESVADHRAQAAELYLAGNPDRLAVVAGEGTKMLGFAEATVRRDYVDGCDTSPVTFPEGIYVRPDARNAGAAKALADAEADRGRAPGCTEYASNALLDNHDSHAFHAAIGFAETERVVFFRKTL